MKKNESFWHIRSAKYDKLFWTKDDSYVDAIIRAGDFKKSDLVLDVGTGTGVMARAIEPHVRHVVGLDFSHSMLEKGAWEGISMIKWDISESLFHNNLFNRLVARMVFHHILDNLDRVFIRCFDLLKEKGKLIVAEGVPPIDDQAVVDWYARMFSLKEERRTFVPAELQNYFKKNGFKKIKTHLHLMEKFSIKNWLVNSGLERKKQKKILEMHFEAPRIIKQAYNMKILRDDCLVDTKNVIIVGEKQAMAKS
jgi:ubiquinone/menaquinone biosynthesis C-methylase UbiE